MPLNKFIQTYFAAPIQVEQGYNLINTTAYAIIAFVLLYAFFRIAQKLNVRIDFHFLVALLPFIFVGSYIRTLVDLKILQRTFYSVSPGIYALITALFVLSFFAGYLIQQEHKIDWWKSALIIGMLLALLNVASTSERIALENFNWLLVILTAWTLGSIILYQTLKRLKQIWGTAKLNFIAISAQFFDAVTTVTILNYIGGVEKHPVPRYIMEKAGSAFAFIPLKLAVVLPAIYLIQSGVKDKDFKNLLLISIAVLGMAQGLRNLLTLILA